ncbi:glycosyltransferase [Streptomyces hirsutus]
MSGTAGEPGALAGALAGLLLDPPLRESLGDLGRRHVLSVHDVRHTAEQVADVYRDLLGTWPSRGRARPSRAVERGEARDTEQGQPLDADCCTEAAHRTAQRVEPTKYRETIRS